MTKRFISSDIWSKPWFEELGPAAKLVFIYLFSNDRTNQSGIYETSPYRISADTGIEKDAVMPLLEELSEKGKIDYDPKTNRIRIINFLEHQALNKKFLIGAIHQVILRFPDELEWFLKHNSRLISYWLKEEELEEILKRSIDTKSIVSDKTIDRVSIEYVKSIDRNAPTGLDRTRQDSTVQKRKDISSEKEKIFSDSSDPYKLSSLLFELSLTLNENSRLKRQTQKERERTIQRWAKDIDLLLRRDGQEPSIVEEVIIWCKHDDFWGANILSGSKLREKWDQLVMQMKKEKEKRKGGDYGRKGKLELPKERDSFGIPQELRK
jgi:hypothetical protein